MSGLNSIGLGLVGDIGGTNARFALVDFDGADPKLIEPTSYKGEDYGQAEDAVEAYLEKMGVRHPDQAVVAVAINSSRARVARGKADFFRTVCIAAPPI